MAALEFILEPSGDVILHLDAKYILDDSGTDIPKAKANPKEAGDVIKYDTQDEIAVWQDGYPDPLDSGLTKYNVDLSAALEWYFLKRLITMGDGSLPEQLASDWNIIRSYSWPIDYITCLVTNYQTIVVDGVVTEGIKSEVEDEGHFFMLGNPYFMNGHSLGAYYTLVCNLLTNRPRRIFSAPGERDWLSFIVPNWSSGEIQELRARYTGFKNGNQVQSAYKIGRAHV